MGQQDWQPPPGWGTESDGSTPPAAKPLYRKKRVLVPAALLALLVAGGSLGDPAPAPSGPVRTLSLADQSVPRQGADPAAAMQAAETATREAAEAAQRAAVDRAAAEKALKEAAAERAAAEQAAAKAAAAKAAAKKVAAAKAAAAKRQAAAAQQAAVTRKAEAAAAKAEQRRQAASDTFAGGSDSDTYTNVDGDEVQRPTRAASRPAGSSAKCRDGTYSFSRHRSGTCSGHGGVATWF